MQGKELEEEKKSCALLQCLTNRQGSLCSIVVSQKKKPHLYSLVEWWNSSDEHKVKRDQEQL